MRLLRFIAGHGEGAVVSRERLAGLVALSWGGWLVWQMFGDGEVSDDQPSPFQDRLDRALRYHWKGNINWPRWAKLGWHSLTST